MIAMARIAEPPGQKPDNRADDHQEAAQWLHPIRQIELLRLCPPDSWPGLAFEVSG
jgi:hypothetical protein